MSKGADSISVFLLIAICLSILHFSMCELGNSIVYKYPVSYFIKREDGKIIIKNYENIKTYVVVETAKNKYVFYNTNVIPINETGTITVKIVDCRNGQTLLSRTFYIDSLDNKMGKNGSTKSVVNVNNGNT